MYIFLEIQEKGAMQVLIESYRIRKRWRWLITSSSEIRRSRRSAGGTTLYSPTTYRNELFSRKRPLARDAIDAEAKKLDVALSGVWLRYVYRCASAASTYSMHFCSRAL